MGDETPQSKVKSYKTKDGSREWVPKTKPAESIPLYITPARKRNIHPSIHHPSEQTKKIKKSLFQTRQERRVGPFRPQNKKWVFPSNLKWNSLYCRKCIELDCRWMWSIESHSFNLIIQVEYITPAITMVIHTPSSKWRRMVFLIFFRTPITTAQPSENSNFTWLCPWRSM